MKRACVIGWPIEHSRSPLIHGYWLKKYGIEGSYTKEAVRPEEVAAFLGSLGDHGFVGCNVTVPHKEAALAAANRPYDDARHIGAANTLWLEDGVLCARNTDTHGYMTYLAESVRQWDKRDAPISILGAGGAARAIVYGFMNEQVGEIRLFNRSRERAELLARHFEALPRFSKSAIKIYDWEQREEKSRDSRVIVNTTSLGLKGVGDLGIDFGRHHPECVVSDIVYVPLETSFLKSARLKGLVTVDGLGMLLHQAVPGFERWFGVRPEVTPELRAIIEADIVGV
jgi:shikimate dehydrogenase